MADTASGGGMSYGLYSFLLTLALFVAMLGLVLLGRRYALHQLANDDSEAGIGPVNGAIFGLLGLMIAFAFSGAAQRFDERRDLIVQEANAIGTAWLRLDLLPGESREVLRALMRDYTDARLAAYRAIPDEAAFLAEFDRANALQTRIWDEATARTTAPGVPGPAAMLLLPALNEMFDITTTRQMALSKHPPRIVYIILGALALISAVLAGHAMGARKRHSLLHLIAYPAIVAVVVNLVINLEHPRLGLVRIDAFDVAIEGARARMGDD
jgi:hypothetical protein